MKFKILVLIILTVVGKSQSQSVMKFNLLTGASIPTVHYNSDMNSSVTYFTETNLDLRGGITYMSNKESRLAVGFYGGLFKLNSFSNTSNSEFRLSGINADFFLKYNFNNSYLNSISVGPFINHIITQYQKNQNQLVESGFTSQHFGIYSEIDLYELVEVSSKTYSVGPYVYYKQTVLNIEKSNTNSENTGYSQLGFGLKINL